MTRAPRRPTATVLTLIAVLLAGAVATDVVLMGDLPRPQPGLGIAFVLITIAFAVGEAVVVHVELGKNAHTVSLAELTLTISMFFLPPLQLPLARVLGGAVVLIAVRRQRPLKLAFNVALWTVDVAVASLVFRSLGGALHGSPQSMLLPAVAAALTAALLDSLAVNAVIATISRELDLRQALRFLRACLLSALGCALAGLVCVGALAYSGWLLGPILAVVAMYLYSFRTLAALRARHADVKVLYEFAAEVTSAGTDEVTLTILNRVTQLLRASSAALYLPDPQAGVLRVSRVVDDALVQTTQDLAQTSSALLQVLEREKPLVLRSGARHPAGRAVLTDLDARDAVLTPVLGEQGLRGLLVVTDRLGEVNTFSEEDGLLLRTLASHVAAALANARLVEQLHHDSLHDSLTGLANRSLFQTQLGRALQNPADVSVLLMDLDRFKEVNDTLGHHHGDLMLQETARRLSGELREGDLLARLGGDEFAVLLTGVSATQAVATAERLLRSLGASLQLQGVETEVGASIGVVHLPQAQCGSVTAPVLLQRADVAMYAAKAQYTGVHLYHDELDGYSPRRLALAGGLRAAIEQGELSLRYQPQIRLSDGALAGVEALVRWEHPTYGEVPPDDFISIAEQTGLIRELTRHVLDLALASCAQWALQGSDLAVSVNLSARNLLEPDLVPAVLGLLAKHGVPGRRLTLEITESHLMADPDRTVTTLQKLADAGVRLSIDDFGTGYSSLSYLKRLPVSEVKIDKTFVTHLARDDEDAAIVEAIIQLAHTLHLDVVAEGVEDEASAQRLRALGSDAMQGFHLAAPLRLEALTSWTAGRPIATRAPRLRAVPPPRPTAIVSPGA